MLDLLEIYESNASVEMEDHLYSTITPMAAVITQQVTHALTECHIQLIMLTTRALELL